MYRHGKVRFHDVCCTAGRWPKLYCRPNVLILVCVGGPYSCLCVGRRGVGSVPEDLVLVVHREKTLIVSFLRPSVAFSSHVDDLSDLVTRLSSIAPQKVADMRSQIRKIRETHFTYRGTMLQISRFLRNPATADLECIKPGSRA